MDNLTFERGSARFLQELRVMKNFSEHTIRNYCIDLNAFKNYLEEQLQIPKDSRDDNLHHLTFEHRLEEEGKLPIEKVDRKLIRGFLADCYQRNGKKTIARRLSSLRSLFGYLISKKLIALNPVEDLENPKLDKKIPSSISYEQVKRLFEQPETENLLGLRDRAIMELFYSSGLRVSELAALNRIDLDFSSLLIRLKGKGKKERIVPITKHAAGWIQHYLNYPDRYLEKDGHAEEQDHEAVFLNKHGTRLTVRSIDRQFQAYLKASGLASSITPHTIRHTIATHWLENGMDMKTIQSILGHSCLATTTIYTQVSTTLKKKVYDAAHPRAK